MGKGHFHLSSTLNLGKAGTSLALGGHRRRRLPSTSMSPINRTDDAGGTCLRQIFRFKEVNGRKVVSTVNGRAGEPNRISPIGFLVNEHGGIDEQGEADVLYRNAGGNKPLFRCHSPMDHFWMKTESH